METTSFYGMAQPYLMVIFSAVVSFGLVGLGQLITAIDVVT